MVCMWLKPGAAKWKVQMNPLRYGGTLKFVYDIGSKPLCICKLTRYVRTNYHRSSTYISTYLLFHVNVRGVTHSLYYL